MAPTWDEGLRTAVKDRTFVYVDTGLAGLTGVVAAGATIRAAVDVTLAGAQPGDAGVPMLTLETTTRSAIELQVPVFADVLDQRADEVARFLDVHDARSEAVVLSGLAVPRASIGERPCWTTDAGLARGLETKAAIGADLDGIIPWIPSEPAPDHVDRRWWDATLERVGCERVVAQSIGLHVGGARTWICDSPQDVRRAARLGGALRVSGYVEGTPANVMACVVDDAVMVLPPSRQLQARSGSQPLYAGNSFDGVSPAARSAMVDDARAAGHALAARGYVGTFGLDCVVDDSDACWYHDLNARVNGVVHAFGFYVPASASLLCAPGWLESSNVRRAEQEIAALVEDRPIARWSLSEQFTPPASVRVPKEGLYRLDPHASQAWYLGADRSFEAVEGDIAYVRPKWPEDAGAVSGDRLWLADMWCTADLAMAFERECGARAMSRLLESLRSADGG